MNKQILAPNAQINRSISLSPADVQVVASGRLPGSATAALHAARCPGFGRVVEQNLQGPPRVEVFAEGPATRRVFELATAVQVVNFGEAIAEAQRLDSMAHH